MKHNFNNTTTVPIDPIVPGSIRSDVNVSGLDGSVVDIDVVVDVTHSFTSDLEIVLVGPRGERVILAEREGGSADDFTETVFDDEASTPISSGLAPFRGRFRPRGDLSVFEGRDPNGTWTLGIRDRAFQDGGALNRWALLIETDGLSNTGPFVFRNEADRRIDPGGPNVVSSAIEVRGLDGLSVDHLSATVDIDHTYASDLTISLVNPAGERVVLADRKGGARDNFRETTFDDGAESPVAGASPPFRGTFRPDQPLSRFEGSDASGTWTLEVNDQAPQDGGFLNFWSMAITTRSAMRPPESPFRIVVNHLRGLSSSQVALFEEAAARWSEIIVGDLPSVTVDGEVIDDLVIDAQGADLGGPGGVLGQAMPTLVRSGSLLPLRGFMEFDVADLDDLEQSGGLLATIVHEMGHVLGIGTLWNALRLLQGAGTTNPVFTGPNAMREYAELIGADVPTPVPVANTGGPGTRDGHWRESVFDSELMTGFIDPVTPISRLTIASLQDMGYQVNYGAADLYVLPLALALARPRRGHWCRKCARRARETRWKVVPVEQTELTS